MSARVFNPRSSGWGRSARSRVAGRGWLAAALLLSAIAAPGAARGPIATPTFEEHIRPILKAHCFDCHGEGDPLRGGLDLRLRRFMIRGGESGPVLAPGKPDDSPLYRLVKTGEMPKRDRKPTPEEVEILRRWIEQGAATLRDEPESLPPGMQITAEEQSHWAFQPVRRPAIPVASGPGPDQGMDSARIRTPVDAFIAATHRRESVGFSPDAPRRSLIRRLYLDLWGLPPTPAEVEAFESDPGLDAYERLVDRLLASPRYGERWGRHWLDVAGYADSDGYTNDDTPRPYSYKYRDYVIAAFNADKPFDRFLTEQLAGDELALARHPSLEAAAQDPEARDWLVATGYLRMAADGTASGGVDQDAARNQVVADTLKIVSSSLLGLTVGCAQCHDHRYDPIPQADYFRLRAVLEPAYDWKKWRKPGERLVSLYTAADQERAREVEAEAARLAAERETRQQVYLDEALKAHLVKFDPALRDPLWAAFKTPAGERTEAQKKLLRENPSANINPGVLYQYNPKAAEDLKSMDARIAEVRGRKPPEDFVGVLSEPPGPPPETRRFHRGDPGQPREVIAPGTLSVLPHPGRTPELDVGASARPTTGRRTAFARWVTAPDHPLVPRVLVNRVWLHHFGRGLVGTPGDFGLQGERPSHPELLDWLAAAFVAPAADYGTIGTAGAVKGAVADPGPGSRSGAGAGAGSGLGWSLKRLHRLILTSTTYRQSSERDPARDGIDPDNRWYWRMPVQRLDAESLRDAMLAASGVLAGRMFGGPVPVREDVVGQVVVGIDRKQGDNKMPVDVPMGEDEFRRSVYVEVRRSKPLAFLNAFDAPVMEVNCERRQVSTVAPQSLMLMNSGFVLQQARLMAERVARESPPAPEPRVELAWRLAYGRSPTPPELNQATGFLTRQEETLAGLDRDRERRDREGNRERPGGGDKGAPPTSAGTAGERALRSLCQVLLGSNEFLYLD